MIDTEVNLNNLKVTLIRRLNRSQVVLTDLFRDEGIIESMTYSRNVRQPYSSLNVTIRDEGDIPNIFTNGDICEVEGNIYSLKRGVGYRTLNRFFKTCLLYTSPSPRDS